MSQAGIADFTDAFPQIPTQFNGNAGTAVPIANIINIVGVTAQGVSTLAAGNTVTITVADATTASKGVAQFDPADFTVVAGVVSISGAGPVNSVSGTPGRITSTGGANPVIDIDATYVGQTSITTLGTVTTGTWNATAVGPTFGGTGLTTYATGDTLYASAVNTLSKLAAGANGQVLTLAAGIPSWATPTTGTVTSVSGTANRITSTGGATPVIDIAASYVGQTSITTLGTITTGVWNGTFIGETFGGTGQTTYTTGDILYASAANTLSKLAIGANGLFLTVAAGIPAWTANAGGDVTGPGASTDNAFTRFDGTTGKIIQNSNAILSDTGSATFNNTTGSTALGVDLNNQDTNAASTSYFNAAVVGGSAADCFMHVGIAAVTNFCWGIDNSDSDKLKINRDAAFVTPSSGTNLWTMTTAGECTMPLQPAFLAYVATTIANVTGDGTLYTIIFDTEVYDQGADFNLGTSTFTAPVTGRYTFCLSCRLLGGTIIGSTILQINTSNNVYRASMAAIAAVATSAVGTVNLTLDMDANDTAIFQVQTTDTGGKIDDVSGTIGGAILNFVSGYLTV